MRSTCFLLLFCSGCAPIAAIPTDSIPGPPPRGQAIDAGDLLRDLGAFGGQVCEAATAEVVQTCLGASQGEVSSNCDQRYNQSSFEMCGATFGDLVNSLLEEAECDADPCGSFHLQFCQDAVELDLQPSRGHSPWSPLWWTGRFAASIEVSGASGPLLPDLFDLSRFGDTVVWRPTKKLPAGDYTAALSVCDVVQPPITFSTTDDEIMWGTYVFQLDGTVVYPSGVSALVSVGESFDFEVDNPNPTSSIFSMPLGGVQFSGNIRAAKALEVVWVDVFGVLDFRPNTCAEYAADCVACPGTTEWACLPIGITDITALAMDRSESQ